jgi:hypothetical protein
VNENHTPVVCPVCLVAKNTRANSCATPIAATPERPVAACTARFGRITSILRSFFSKCTSGITLSAANLRTAARNAVPTFSRIAGDGVRCGGDRS